MTFDNGIINPTNIKNKKFNDRNCMAPNNKNKIIMNQEKLKNLIFITSKEEFSLIVIPTLQIGHIDQLNYYKN